MSIQRPVPILDLNSMAMGRVSDSHMLLRSFHSDVPSNRMKWGGAMQGFNDVYLYNLYQNWDVRANYERCAQLTSRSNTTANTLVAAIHIRIIYFVIWLAKPRFYIQDSSQLCGVICSLTISTATTIWERKLLLILSCVPGVNYCASNNSGPRNKYSAC